MTVSAEMIERKLADAFAPSRLEVFDESEQHRGHGGWREGGGTHFRVLIRAAAFEGISRLQRGRAVHQVLREEMEAGLHALALDLGGPDAA